MMTGEPPARSHGARPRSPSRALHGWLAHAGSPRPKNPPEPPLCKGGKGNGPVLLIFPPLRRGGLGGVDSHRPRGVLYSIVNRPRVVHAWTAYLARRQAGVRPAD